MPIVLLAATTDATASSEYVAKYDDLPISFRCPGVAGAEVGTVQFKDSAGSWHDYYVGGNIWTITATVSNRLVEAPGTYRVNKDATVAATPVEVSTRTTP